MILTDVRNKLFCHWTVDKRKERKLPMWRKNASRHSTGVETQRPNGSWPEPEGLNFRDQLAPQHWYTTIPRTFAVMSLPTLHACGFDSNVSALVVCGG
jgi:hypothetical protein